MGEQTITCPNCGRQIPLTKALTAQIEENVKKDFEKDIKKREEELKTQYQKRLDSELSKAKKEAEKAFDEDIVKLEKKLMESQLETKSFKDNFEKHLKNEVSKVRFELKKEAEKSVSKEMETLKNRLVEKDKIIKDVKQKESELDNFRCELERKEKNLQKEVERKIALETKKIREEVSKQVYKDYYDKELVLEKEISNLKKHINELKQQSEQSPSHLKGEVMEEEFEKILSRLFPFDDVTQISKSKGGADISHIIMNSQEQKCGSIIWEIKNTKTWNKKWLSKLRNDQRKIKADIAVLMTRVLPENVQHLKFIDNVWVCDFSVVEGLAAALRFNLIEIANLKGSSFNTDKLKKLHDYLLSNEFKQRIQAIVEAFFDMKSDLEKERQSAERTFSKREKQLQMAVQNLAGMYGEMQALIGPSLAKIKRLELPAPKIGIDKYKSN
jgi:hypothetical protein